MFNTLSDQERHILIDKGTEPAFSWEYRNHKESWYYACRQCDTQLFASSSKFDSGCGRPSFDDAIPGTVLWTSDADGSRTEITCAHCGWHLWHVFIWEQSTAKNTRYCVNSVSLKFVPEANPDDQWSYQTIILGWWCFRCTEAVFQKVPGVIDLKSWYTGGKRQYPSYEQITTWASGHVEVIKVVFDPVIVSLAELLNIFLQTHDPTSVDKQWHDEWSQYRSAIFTTSDEQATQVQQYLDHVSGQFESPLVTQVKPLQAFWIAEDYHQNFFVRNPNKPYCQMVVKNKVEKAEHILLEKTATS